VWARPASRPSLPSLHSLKTSRGHGTEDVLEDEDYITSLLETICSSERELRDEEVWTTARMACMVASGEMGMTVGAAAIMLMSAARQLGPTLSRLDQSQGVGAEDGDAERRTRESATEAGPDSDLNRDAARRLEDQTACVLGLLKVIEFLATADCDLDDEEQAKELHRLAMRMYAAVSASTLQERAQASTGSSKVSARDMGTPLGMMAAGAAVAAAAAKTGSLAVVSSILVSLADSLLESYGWSLPNPGQLVAGFLGVNGLGSLVSLAGFVRVPANVEMVTKLVLAAFVVVATTGMHDLRAFDEGDRHYVDSLVRGGMVARREGNAAAAIADGSAATFHWRGATWKLEPPRDTRQGTYPALTATEVEGVQIFTETWSLTSAPPPNPRTLFNMHDRSSCWFKGRVWKCAWASEKDEAGKTLAHCYSNMVGSLDELFVGPQPVLQAHAAGTLTETDRDRKVDRLKKSVRVYSVLMCGLGLGMTHVNRRRMSPYEDFEGMLSPYSEVVMDAHAHMGDSGNEFWDAVADAAQKLQGVDFQLDDEGDELRHEAVLQLVRRLYHPMLQLRNDERVNPALPASLSPSMQTDLEDQEKEGVFQVKLQEFMHACWLGGVDNSMGDINIAVDAREFAQLVFEESAAEKVSDEHAPSISERAVLWKLRLKRLNPNLVKGKASPYGAFSPMIYRFCWIWATVFDYVLSPLESSVVLDADANYMVVKVHESVVYAVEVVRAAAASSSGRLVSRLVQHPARPLPPLALPLGQQDGWA
jgi:hypothetical protein